MGAIYRTVSALSPTEAAHLAGLIDGEGTIGLTRRHREEERQLVVSISNTERALLEYVLKIVGAGRITKKRTYRDTHSRSFTFAIDNRQALALLEQVSPYLRTYKAARAQLVLDHYVKLTPRNGRYTDAIKEQRNSFENRFLAIKPLVSIHMGA